MVGAWEFSNADHDKICHFNFRADAVPNGYKLDIDKNCPNLFPSTKNMVAWSVDNFGSLRLLDAGGNSVVDLSEVETGMYDGFTPEEGRYVLQAATSAPELSAGDIAGDWAVTRGAGKPICLLTLANNSHRRRHPGAEGQAGLRRLRHALRPDRLAHGRRRIDADLAERADLAVRTERRQYLAARARIFRSGPPGAAVIDNSLRKIK